MASDAIRHGLGLCLRRWPIEAIHNTVSEGRMTDQQAAVHGRREVLQRRHILGEPTKAEPAWLGTQETQAGRWRARANEGCQADTAIAGNQGGHPLGDFESHRRMREQRPVVMGMRVDKSRRHHLTRRLNDTLRARRGQGTDR